MLKDKLLELRKSNKKNQSDLADLLNISIAAYGHYESGRSEPDINSLIKIANYYDVSVDYLVDRQNENITLQDIKASAESLSKERLIEIVNKQIDLLLLIHKNKN